MSGFGAIFTIILVVIWVVKGLASVTANPKDTHDNQQKRRSSQEMPQRQETLSERRSDAASQDPSQMTMAERIELARQRAREQAGVAGQGDEQAQAQRRAKARAEQQAQQKRERAQQHERIQRERAEQERAARKRQEAKLRRQRQAEQERQVQAQRQRRSKQQRRAKPAQAKTNSPREHVVAESMQRIHKGHKPTPPAASGHTNAGKSGAAASLGLLDRNSLRKAFIMKELLDKPVALRNPQADLPS